MQRNALSLQSQQARHERGTAERCRRVVALLVLCPQEDLSERHARLVTLARAVDQATRERGESAARAHLLVDKHEAIGEREAEQRRVRLPVHLCESSNEPLAEVLVVLKQEPQRLVDADVGVGEVLEPTPGDASVVLACSCGRVRRGGVMQRTHSVDSDGDLVQRHLLRTVSFHRGPRCVDLRLQRSEGGHVEQACVLALGLSRVLRSRQQRQGA